LRQDPKTIDGLDVKSVNERRFIARLELLGHLAESNERELLGEIAASLHEEVASMNPENFVVRPHREMVAKFTQSDAWSSIDEATRNRLAEKLAPLPTQLPSEHQATGTAEGLVSGLACPTGFPEGGRKGFELCPITSVATRGVLRNADSTVTARSETLGTKELNRDGNLGH
jgi:hypothetical protein